MSIIPAWVSGQGQEDPWSLLSSQSSEIRSCLKPKGECLEEDTRGGRLLHTREDFLSLFAKLQVMLDGIHNHREAVGLGDFHRIALLQPLRAPDPLPVPCLNVTFHQKWHPKDALLLPRGPSSSAAFSLQRMWVGARRR